MKELISVIVPVYKVEKWLDECVESIINQTYKNLEIVLVDDGSPDNCPMICDDWAKRDSRIKVIHKVNGGLSSARNVALDVITGKYISFVDSDDYIHPEMIRTMYNDIKKSAADIVRCGKFTDNNGKIEENNAVKTTKVYLSEEIMECYFYHKDDFNSGVWDKLFKAELFENVRFPDGINSEDYYVYAMIYRKCKKLYYNNDSLYFYRIRENSICNTGVINEHSFDKIKVSDMVYDYILENEPEYKIEARAYQVIARFAVYYFEMHHKHNRITEKEWRRDLRSMLKDTLKDKKFSVIFKAKYCIMCVSPRLYVKLKEGKAKESVN